MSPVSILVGRCLAGNRHNATNNTHAPVSCPALGHRWCRGYHSLSLHPHKPLWSLPSHEEARPPRQHCDVAAPFMASPFIQNRTQTSQSGNGAHTDGGLDSIAWRSAHASQPFLFPRLIQPSTCTSLPYPRVARDHLSPLPSSYEPSPLLHPVLSPLLSTQMTSNFPNLQVPWAIPAPLDDFGYHTFDSLCWILSVYLHVISRHHRSVAQAARHIDFYRPQ